MFNQDDTKDYTICHAESYSDRVVYDSRAEFAYIYIRVFCPAYESVFDRYVCFFPVQPYTFVTFFDLDRYMLTARHRTDFLVTDWFTAGNF